MEFLAQAEPLPFVMAAVWLFAAGMFPVGIMLGSSCSQCCGKCGLCGEGELPDTLTVAFDSFTDQSPGPSLIALSFSACFGGGAAGTVTGPGGTAGAISSVSLTSGGSGYAQLGRVSPTITISGGSGTGATFTPTLAAQVDGCGVDYWELSSATATGGTGYVNGDELTFTVASGDTEQDSAVAKLGVGRAEPELTLATGTATATVNLEYQGTSEAFSYATGVWGVAPNALTITDGGSGYTEGGAIEFDYAGDDVELTAATATANVVHDEPIATFSVSTTGGSGAEFEAVWELLPEEEWPAPHKKSYRLTAVNVIDGGTGYGEYEQITISFASADDGVVVEAAWADTDVPDGSGTIQTVFVGTSSLAEDEGPAGKYTGSRTDALHSVTRTAAGGYYKDDPDARRVDIITPGVYYREDETEPPYVSTPTVSISQMLPSAGTGASITATVNSTVGHADFGKVTALTIASGGSGYLAHVLLDNCLMRFSGRTLVLQRETSSPCIYSYATPDDCSGYSESVYVEYRGPSLLPQLSVNVGKKTLILEGEPAFGAGGSGILDAVAAVTDCGDLNVEFSPALDLDENYLAPIGMAATVSAGGEYEEPQALGPHITAEELDGLQVTVEWDGQTMTEVFSASSEDWCGIAGMSFGFLEQTDPGVRFEWQGAVDVTNLGGGMGCSLWRCQGLFQFRKYYVGAAVETGASPYTFYLAAADFELPEPIPVDGDGFPSGSLTISPSSYVTNDYSGSFTDDIPTDPTLTITFSRVLP